MRDPKARERLYRRLLRQQKIEALIARSLTRRKRTWLDRLVVALVTRIAPQGDEAFMRDPLTDDTPEFDPKALQRLRGSGGREEK
jgi:hypothetical protein